MIRHANNERGFALVIGMLMLILVSFLGITAIQTSDTDVSIAGNEVKRTQAFYLAEAGAERVAGEIIRNFELTGVPPSPLPAGAFTFAEGYSTYQTTDLGPAAVEDLTSGAYAGLYGLVKSFQINSTGRVTNEPQQVEIELVVQDALVPVFQFAVFYEDDLEFHPGPDMTIGGRMHTNHDMYLGAGNSLHIDSYVTAAGNILASRKPGASSSYGTGNVYIKDADDNYEAMKVGSDWLDSNDSTWVNESLTRWDGRVEDGNHGITNLKLPVVTSGPATDLIDPDNGGTNPDSYENKADLKIVNGQALYNNSGTWMDVTASLQASGALTTSSFYNGREGQWVTATEIDVHQLGGTSYYPGNGIIYTHTDPVAGTEMATRLVNGAELPGALTLASSNPVYTVGDYNTSHKKPAAIMTDAYTILSNDWDDSKSDQSLSNRYANNTTINVAFMTGNTITGDGGADYNGGLENLPRLLEDWGGQTLKLRGSFVDLWQSRQAEGAWSYGSYYKAPRRDWGFDPDFLDPTKLPPGTPRVNVSQKTSWRQSMADAGP